MDIKTIDCIGKTILVIADTHFPHHVKNTIPFLRAIKRAHNPDIIVHLGDELDCHAMSFHDTDPDIEYSASGELKKAKKSIKCLEKLFSGMYLLNSNHGSMVYRRAKADGVPRHYLKSLAEVYETPKWFWYDDLVLQTKRGDIYCCHGKSKAYGKLCKEMGMSAIQGHYHSLLEVTNHKAPNGMRFNAFAGSFADVDSLAMAYGKNFVNRPILGCILINKHGKPNTIMMPENY